MRGTVNRRRSLGTTLATWSSFSFYVPRDPSTYIINFVRTWRSTHRFCPFAEYNNNRNSSQSPGTDAIDSYLRNDGKSGIYCWIRVARNLLFAPILLLFCFFFLSPLISTFCPRRFPPFFPRFDRLHKKRFPLSRGKIGDPAKPNQQMGTMMMMIEWMDVMCIETTRTMRTMQRYPSNPPSKENIF